MQQKIPNSLEVQAGLASFDTSLTPEDFSREGIKANKVGEVVARQEQDFPADGNRRQYHAVTRGWVINEVFRFIIMMADLLGLPALMMLLQESGSVRLYNW